MIRETTIFQCEPKIQDQKLKLVNNYIRLKTVL